MSLAHEEATSNEPSRRWPTEGVDQPWSIGEAIGVTMRSMTRAFASLTLPVLLITLLGSVVAVSPLAWAVRVYLFDRQILAALGLARPQVGFSGLGTTWSAPLSVTLGVPAISLLAFVLSTTLALAVGAEAALFAIRADTVPRGRLRRALRRSAALFAWQVGFALSVAILPALVFGIPALVAHVLGTPPATGVWQVVGILPPFFLGAYYLTAFAWAPFFMVDDDASFFAAMRESRRASRPYSVTLFLYLVTLAPIALFMLAPVVGVVALAFVWTGLAYGYVRATGRSDLPWFSAEFASRSIRTFLKVIFVTLAIPTGGLIAWVRGLPTTRGTAATLQDSAVRVAAIVSSVAVVVVILALLMPYALDRLEGRRFSSFIAARHVRSQKSGFLTAISVLSICGVAISSCSLSGVVSVMGGFGQDLKRKILGNNAHIVIDTTAHTAWDGYEATLNAARSVPGVTGASPIVQGEVMASSASNLAGVMVTGIEPKSMRDLIELPRNIEVGKLDYLEHPERLTRLPATEVIGLGPGGETYLKGSDPIADKDDLDPEVRAILVNKPDRPGIILGRELAKTLHVYLGDEITLVSPLGDLGPMGVMPKTKRFRVAAIFYSGMYEYDAMNVYTLLDEAQGYFATGDKIHGIDIKVDDADKAETIAKAIADAIARPELRIRDWREINKNLFSALKIERFATFVILSIAILVASFCIVCTLLLMVTEKGKEIAILKALGASDGAILRTFMLEGIIIGAIGTVFGVVTGLALCTGLKWFGLRLDPEVYYIDRLPVSVNGWDFLTVASAAMTICTLSTLYPAYAASKLRPVDGLRYE
jgi:lipoprotein-releasing system permease protein